MRGRPLVTRIVLAVALGVGAVLMAASPAEAHSVSGMSATNYRTVLRSVTPEVPGVSVEVIEGGSRLQVTNDTDLDLVVFGYQGEPYLRIGSDGVFENRRSPAVYLNADGDGTTNVPASATAEADPEWVQASDGQTARFHDHRTHWMAEEDPPAVERAPGERHVVTAWEVAMRIGDRDVTAAGELVWVPGPSLTPWAALAVLVAVAAAAVAVRGGLPAVAGLLGVLVGVDLWHALGVAWAAAGSTAERLDQVVTGSPPSLVAWAAAAVAIALLAKRRVDGLFFAVFAALVIAVAGGIGDVAHWSRSVVPFAGGAVAARLVVSLTVGVGFGLAGAAVWLAWRQLSRPADFPVVGQEHPEPGERPVSRSGPAGLGSGPRRSG